MLMSLSSYLVLTFSGFIIIFRRDLSIGIVYDNFSRKISTSILINMFFNLIQEKLLCFLKFVCFNCIRMYVLPFSPLVP